MAAELNPKFPKHTSGHRCQGQGTGGEGTEGPTELSIYSTFIKTNQEKSKLMKGS